MREDLHFTRPERLTERSVPSGVCHSARSTLHAAPITSLGRSGQAVDYRFVVIELDDMEAEAANWRAGFYKTAFSPVEVVTKLGKPNAA